MWGDVVVYLEYRATLATQLTETGDVARCWWSLPRGTQLLLSDGSVYFLLSGGRPGGPAGPDVRDAVFLLPTSDATGPEQRLVGDVEFHLRASDWYTHRHQTDRRYNRVILHVVFFCDRPERPALRQDGTVLPLCSLYDLRRPDREVNLPEWPCQQTFHRLDADSLKKRLLRAGLLRFEQKRDRFIEQIHRTQPVEDISLYDVCLIPALVESLGYGRDRDLFRALGEYLVDINTCGLPEPAGRVAAPPALDAARLKVLCQLIGCWRETGVWKMFWQELGLREGEGSRAALARVRWMLRGVGRARADISICNVILPFAAAVAMIEHDMILLEVAQTLYYKHPGLPSNQITRAMCQQLDLAVEPDGACCQQGLHYIYQQTCREKLCGQCVVGKRTI